MTACLHGHDPQQREHAVRDGADRVVLFRDVQVHRHRDQAPRHHGTKRGSGIRIPSRANSRSRR
jgi:hypothetical protein